MPINAPEQPRPVRKLRALSAEELAKLADFTRGGVFVRGHHRGRKACGVEYVLGGRLVRRDGSPLRAGFDPGWEHDATSFYSRWGKKHRLIEHEKEVVLATLLGTRDGREGFWGALFDMRWEDTREHVAIGPRGDAAHEVFQNTTRRVRLGQRVHFVVELVRDPETNIVSTFDSLCGRYVGVSSATTLDEAQPYHYLRRVHDIVEREDFCATCAGMVLEQKL